MKKPEKWPSLDQDMLVFVSDSIENLPKGWRARMTYRILNEDGFTETFELAAPGKEFAPLLQHVLKRRR